MGSMSLPLLRDAGRFGDLSFGLYLYAFPIQQLILHLAPTIRYPVLACVAATTVTAFCSWHLVEKIRRPPPVQLADSGPRRAPLRAGA